MGELIESPTWACCDWPRRAMQAEADLAAAKARAERAEAVLRAIVDEDWDTLGTMSGESAADCRFTVHNYIENVLQTRANAIDGAAQAALDAIAEDADGRRT